MYFVDVFTYRKNKDSEKPGLEIKAHPPSVLARSANMFIVGFAHQEHSQSAVLGDSDEFTKCAGRARICLGERSCVSLRPVVGSLCHHPMHSAQTLVVCHG
uniref:Uncharacterized protein n=1 Tax=Candidatus Kentrum sp. UNK TaxID=2126344 RepID=A0A451ALX8_9GAMM|nr:MAG: hypothetical protein BECKUNK1418G_GA0071005_112310 [Candidatus Kentron sp. UNK]